MFRKINFINQTGRNSIWLLFARITAQVLNLLFVAFAARKLGIPVFGEFTVIASMVVLGNSVTTFGTETLLIRDLAKEGKVSRVISNALGLQLTLSALWCLIAYILNQKFAFLIYTLSLFPMAFISVTSAILRAFQRMDLYWIIILVSSLLQLLGILVVDDLVSLCTFLFFGQIFTAIIAYLLGNASISSFRLIPSIYFFSIVSMALPFAAMTVLSVGTQRLGIFFLSILSDSNSVGLYSVAFRITEALKLGHYAVLGALLPVLSEGNMGSNHNFKQSFWIILTLSLLIAICFTVLSKFIINMLFGIEFQGASQLISIFVWQLIPYTLSSFLSVAFVAKGKEWLLIKFMVASLLIISGLYMWLISLKEVNGAVIASVIGEICQAIILLAAAFRIKELRELWTTKTNLA